MIEVTLRTKAAMDAIRAIAAEVPDCVVGVGTVTRPSDISAAIAAGAKYLVSPGTPSELAAALADASVPVLPGCATVSEAMALTARGFKVLKFFPAEASGGVAWLKSVAAPLPDLEVLSDRRDRRKEHRGLSRLPERARGRRLVGRAEGCDRVRRLGAHHAAGPRGRRVAPLTFLLMSAPIRRPTRAFDWSAAVIAALAATAAVTVYLRDGQARFLSILTDDLGLFGEMLPKVLAGCLIGAFVTLLLPRELVARWVGAGIRHRRHPGCDVRRRDPAGRAVHHLSGRGRVPRRRRGCRRGLRVRDLVDADRLHPRDRVGAAVLRARLRHVARHLLAAAADPRRDLRRARWRSSARRNGAPHEPR